MLKHKNEKMKDNNHDYSNEELKRLGIFRDIKNKIKKDNIYYENERK